MFTLQKIKKKINLSKVTSFQFLARVFPAFNSQQLPTWGLIVTKQWQHIGRVGPCAWRELSWKRKTPRLMGSTKTQAELLLRKGKDGLLLVLPENPVLYHLPPGAFWEPQNHQVPLSSWVGFLHWGEREAWKRLSWLKIEGGAWDAQTETNTSSSQFQHSHH